MITSRPKYSALFSLGIFVLACFSVGGYNLSAILDDQGWWLNYFLSALLLTLGLAILMRQLWSYKIVRIDKSKLFIKYPLRFSQKALTLKEISYWEETIIKTGNGQFKQVEMVFDHEKVQLTMQENTNYSRILTYLAQMLSSKRRK